MQGLGFDGPVFGPVLDFEPSVLGPGLVLSLVFANITVEECSFVSLSTSLHR